MNDLAEKCLARAEGFLVRGDEFYGKAAEAILAAQKADPTLSNVQIGKRLGRDEQWVRTVVRWHTEGSDAPTPFARSTDPGVLGRNVKLGLSKMTGEQIDGMVQGLPPKQAAKLAASALSKPGVAVELAKDPDQAASVTRASGEIREHREHTSKQKNKGVPGSALASITFISEVMGGIIGAKRKLNESYTAARDHELNDEQREAVSEMLDEVTAIVDWYRSYLDSGDKSFEDELSKLLSN